IVSIAEPPPNGKFKAPEDLAFDGSGRLVVADTGNNRVQFLGADGSWLWTWGKAGGAAGTGNGEFNAPSEVAISGSTLVVAERGNNRIQTFDLASPQATRIAAWGSSGSGQGQFANIDGLACDGSYLYVSDTDNDRLQVFTLAGAWQKTWTGPFQDPRGLDIRGGYLYVINNRYESGYHPFILKLELADALTMSGDVTSAAQTFALSGGILAIPSDMAMSATTIYFSEKNLGQLSAYDLASGAYLWRKAGPADSIGDLAGLAVGPTGKLFGADVWYSLISSFDAAAGGYLANVGEPSYPSDGTLGAPYDAAVSADGSRVYVLDWSYNRVQVFLADGSTVIDAWGKPYGRSGTGQGEFYQPNRLAVGPQGRIFVADLGNNRVQVLNQDGSFAAAWGNSAPVAGSGAGEFSRPMGVAISARDNLAYV
ncbi:MAG: NHL repeat-containing protein, partial [Spirochaetaceae bacterium]|nr:NHL repeat-containing protein [Spirochaetaceae bacterium]